MGWSALAVVLTGWSRTAAMVRFNGISVRIATVRSTIRRGHNRRLLKNSSPQVVVFDLRLPSVDPVGPAEIDEVYVSAGKKGHECDRPSHSRGLSRRGRGTYQSDQLPVFILVNRRTDQRYVIPAKAADESTIRLLLETTNRSHSPSTRMAFGPTSHLTRTTRSAANTSSTATVNMPLTKSPSIPARPTRR